jgi:hypothetical protein
MSSGLRLKQGTITDEEDIELAGIDVLLEEAKDDKKYYRELIRLAIKEPPETRIKIIL